MGVDADKLSLGMVKLEWGGVGGTDLGYIRAASIEPVLTFLQHYNARGGMRVMDKELVTQKEIRIAATFEEVSVGNLVLFFGGGTVNGGGTQFPVLTDPVKEGAIALTFNPTSMEKPYQKIVWAIVKARLKANGAFGFNDADWMGADILIEVLYDGDHADKPYGEMTVTKEE